MKRVGGLPQGHSAFNTVEFRRLSCMHDMMAVFKYMKDHHLRESIECSKRPQENELQKMLGSYKTDCNCM